MPVEQGDYTQNVRISCVIGGQAKSAFRVNQLVKKIQPLVPQLESLSASYLYFISAHSSFSDDEQILLLDLLSGSSHDPVSLFSTKSILIVPRFGTISAWCTKAMEILKSCGFGSVQRIEQGIFWEIESRSGLNQHEKAKLLPFLHDRMVESQLESHEQIELIFKQGESRPVSEIDYIANGIEAIKYANMDLGLALSDKELAYFSNWYDLQGRNPTDAEIMMFSQVNSEHCRHKIFNATWQFDSEKREQSMFSMVQETHNRCSDRTLVAYKDNASVIEGRNSTIFSPLPQSRLYRSEPEPVHIIFKAETHNHPTGISPFPGAATGAGGEIRDEGATGVGGKPKAGLCGFSVSNLRVPGLIQPWEQPPQFPDRIASPLEIMLEAPIGSASFNNEFGRPNIGGYFRTFETSSEGRESWHGFHKPIMFAGGLGNIRHSQIEKRKIECGDLLIVIGGPSMLIGLGGGAASSLGQGCSSTELDFASVQRSNPEMQRRCQEVIDRCRELGDQNPIRSIHDVGAGGLSNALPEIVHAAGLGAKIELRKIPTVDSGMSPMEIWCNEAQERYVLAISQFNLDVFSAICQRERCPFAVVGEATLNQHLSVFDSNFLHSFPVDIDIDFLMNGFIRTEKSDKQIRGNSNKSGLELLVFDDCVERVMRFPSVSDKSFLITIGDRTVTGLIHRDQMVGPWQVPVADAAVTLSDYHTVTGEAMAVGERSPVAILDAPASARLSIGEALTNLRSTSVLNVRDVRLCANWMAAASLEGESYQLYEAVRSVALDVCIRLGISIPVGKDSLSMSTTWDQPNGISKQVHSPLTLIATAFAAVDDVQKSLTPQLIPDFDSEILLIDLGGGKDRLGMSALYQTYKYLEGVAPDMDSVGRLGAFFNALGELINDNKVMAYHDRSDGGLFATLCEMSFAGRVGLRISVERNFEIDPISFFFNEELGAVIQVSQDHADDVRQCFRSYQILDHVYSIGQVTELDEISLSLNGHTIYKRSRTELHRIWSELSWKMRSLRDNPLCAQMEYDRILDIEDPGLNASGVEVCSVGDYSNLSVLSEAPTVVTGKNPTVAILREQGVNGHVEMAAAFDKAGLDAYDVVMADLVADEATIERFDGLVMCGGFSFGDVFGAGQGWASTIMCQPKVRDMFEAFFADSRKFSLGVCNGCQTMAELRSIIPGARQWPRFVRNQSEQFEARLVSVNVCESVSVLNGGLSGETLPVAVAHGEGQAVFESEEVYQDLKNSNQIFLNYVDNRDRITQIYPNNPNGSEHAVAGVTNSDGRITILMPHPERVFRRVQLSWAPDDWLATSPWLNLFVSAREWLK